METPASLLPSFLIIGERRCGTTGLGRWLSAHPDVWVHPHDDMAFFIESEIVGRRAWLDGEADADAWEATHDPDQYAQLFAPAHRAQGGVRAIGEKSADLLFWRPAHARLARFVPEAKLVVTLRDPITRAWSHYWNEVGKGRETLSFGAALEAEKERCTASAWARDHLSYRARGHYADSLADLFRVFPPERIHVRSLEQAAIDPGRDLAALYRFLDVDPELGQAGAGSRHNRNRTLSLRPWAMRLTPAVRLWLRACEALTVRLTRDTRRRDALRHLAKQPFYRPARDERMPGDVQAMLLDHYRSHVAALEDLLDRRFPEWLG